MEEESRGGGATTSVGDREDPAKDLLRHFECLRVGDEEEDQGGIEGIFCFQSHGRWWGGHLESRHIFTRLDSASPRNSTDYTPSDHP